jgi:hypothetical protein
MRRRLAAWAALLPLLLLPIGAASADPAALPAHRADYRLSREGLAFANMSMTLERAGTAYHYHARTRPSDALALVSMAVEIAPNAKVTEESHGQVEAGRYRPETYRFRRDNTEARELTIKFDRAGGRALTTSEDQPWSMEVPEGVVDKLVVLLALRRDLAAGAADVTYAVADGGRLKSYRYRRVGEGHVSVPAGSWDCVEVARTKDGEAVDYRLWLAPALDYLPVLVEREEAGVRYRMELTSLRGAEKASPPAE